MHLRKFSLLVLLLSVAELAQAEGFRLANQEGRMTEYSGMLTLTGRFERRQDAETLVWRGDRVCFWPDAEFLDQLPGNKKSDERFFCFSNHTGSLAKLKLPSLPPQGSCGMAGKAKVVISRYVVERGNAFDQAWLDRAEDVGAPTLLPCP
ncbi:MAG: hypothetical protein K0R03_1912 [Moraxellaceae bacterium]|jgi:hypothetical protein|nr:hypothetical protein [Moraxellaceae bacterium]MDF3031354.1 hypothetical protein [Moraxellaceae bacterium]